MVFPRFRPVFVVRRAFTLVELLASIGIIALLAVLVTGGTQKAIAKSKEAGSISNLRTIGQSIIAYAGENNNRYPYNAATGATKPYWTTSVMDYLPEKSNTFIDKNGKPFVVNATLSCPLLGPTRHHSISDYGVNDAILIRQGANTTPMSVAAVPKPSQTVLCMTAAATPDDDSGGTWYVNTTGYVNGSGQSFVPSDHGMAAVLAVYGDGHTQAIPTEIFKTDRRKYLLPTY